MQHGHRDDEGAVEPVRHVNVLDTTLRNGGEEHDCVSDPDDRNQQVDRPFEFGVFLTLRDAQRQRNGREHNDELPAPERECGKLVERQPYVTGALHDIIGRREQRRTAECENDRIGMQRPQTAVGQERQIEIECRPNQLGGDEDADEHADNAPDHDHDRELAHYLVIIGSCCVQLGTPRLVFLGIRTARQYSLVQTRQAIKRILIYV